MNNLQNVSVTPVMVCLFGSTKTERKLSALDHMGSVALVATAAMGGKVGKAAMGRLGETYTAHAFAEQAAWPTCNYKDLAAFIAGQVGEDVIISNRASYLGLADRMQERINTVKASKSGGMRTLANGISEANAAHKTLLGLLALVNEVYVTEAQISAQRKADAKAKADAAQQALPSA